MKKQKQIHASGHSHFTQSNCINSWCGREPKWNKCVRVEANAAGDKTPQTSSEDAGLYQSHPTTTRRLRSSRQQLCPLCPFLHPHPLLSHAACYSATSLPGSLFTAFHILSGSFDLTHSNYRWCEAVVGFCYKSLSKFHKRKLGKINRNRQLYGWNFRY